MNYLIGILTLFFMVGCASQPAATTETASAETAKECGAKCATHGNHVHDANCGHKAVQHDGHTDYEHDGHTHASHDGHYDEHCKTHKNHAHKHGAKCGHKAVQHDGHTDYMHDGHQHSIHAEHVDEHGKKTGTN